MVLIVLRHSQSVWNKENRFTGWSEVGLSEKGIEEAKNAGKLLKKYDFDHIFVSSMIRTRETFKYVMNGRRNDNACSLVFTDELKERNYGALNGLNKDEIKREYGEEKMNMIRRGYFTTPPAGESLAQVRKRAGDFYDTYIKHPKNITSPQKEHVDSKEENSENSENSATTDDEQNTLIISHGNTLRSLFVHWGFFTSSTVASFEIPTGVPIVVDIENHTYYPINPYELVGYQITDSRGQPTVEVKCYDKRSGKCVGKGSSPSGASCGSNEAHELRDGNKSLYKGKSVFNAVENVTAANQKLILNDETCLDLAKIDDQIKALDKSDLKTTIGGNATTAMSFCLADVAASLAGKELYEYLAESSKTEVTAEKLPTPLVNIINGGKHGVTEDLKIQEFMIFADEKFSVEKKTQMMCETYHTLKEILVTKYGPMAKSIGDEGGFCPPIHTAEEALSVIEESIQEAGYKVGKDVFIALDCAASEFYNEETKEYEVEKGKLLSGTELVDYYGDLIKTHPALRSIEDAFHETDYESWKQFTKQYGDKVMIVGDDLFTTNRLLVEEGLREKWANTLLLKVNQIGTVSEAIESANLMFAENKDVIVSHRSGETTHAYLIDIAVGIGAKYVKIGSPCRGERVAKFNRLVEIAKHMEFQHYKHA